MSNHAEAAEEVDLELPPGFGFHPTDEVIISHYLTRKALDPLFDDAVMGEVNLNKCEPWDLPAKAKMGGRDEWYFFWHKPAGKRTNYGTESGHWHIDGHKEILFRGRGVLVGMKRCLVFIGRAPRYKRTGWVMYEYRLEGKMPHPPPRSDKEWVVCKVIHRKRHFPLQAAFFSFLSQDQPASQTSQTNWAYGRPSTLETMESDNFGADLLVSVLRDRSSTPQKLPLECLRRITNGFSDERLLGEGGFGKVYKGVLPDGQMVAVKKLNQFKPGVHDKQFENEVRHLIRLTHPNIVCLLGYCYEIHNQYMTYDEKGIFAGTQERLLCLEFMSNGSLDNHISDECSGLDWHTRYKIIHGTCFGVHYLHEECRSEINATIVHLDLKPANILLGYDMVPKIADFGISKLFCDTKTQTYATSLKGSRGYMAPEYFFDNKITTAADMYSLGIIIIEIITGRKFHLPLDSSRQDIVDFIESALKKWTSRQEASEPCENLENHYHQIKFCLEIGMRCIEFDPMKRPNIRDVYNEFNKWLSIKPEVNGCTACRKS